ncbi:MAG TPA: hypothetical protein VFR38_05135 [Gaiellaceae bacterium]|nr:hypothetical protein [Gaiellaceae bacterium]
MSLVDAIRPGDENVALLLHVLGAMILVGGLLTAVSFLALARENANLLRFGYVALLAAALPGWIGMFAGAEWIYRAQGLADEPIDSAWVLTGFLVAELGGALLLAALILGGVGVHRLRAGKGRGLLEATMAISIVLLVANLVAVWAMAGKPD